MQRGSAGLTLIELMVALAIAAILAAVAYPSYQDQVRKGRRADAQAVMLEASQFMERYATENLRYDQNVAKTPVALPATLAKAPKEGTKLYDITLAATQNGYTLSAVPTGVQTGDACGTMTLTHTGSRSAARSDCWRR